MEQGFDTHNMGPLPWERVKEYLTRRLAQEQAKLLQGPLDVELARSQGRASILMELLNLPQMLAAMEANASGAEARSPRQLWPGWVPGSSNRPDAAGSPGSPHVGESDVR